MIIVDTNPKAQMVEDHLHPQLEVNNNIYFDGARAGA